MIKIDYHNRKYKKMKCFICGKDEKMVDDRVVKRFCCECINSNKYIKYKMQEKQRQRLEELKK